MDLVLWGAAAVNASIAILGLSLRFRHQEALAALLDVELRGRPPKSLWKRVRKWFGLRGSVTSGFFFAFSEVLLTALWAVVAAALALTLSTAAAVYAVNHTELAITLDGEATRSPYSVGLALISHVAETYVRDAFVLTGLPRAEFDGGIDTTALLFSATTVSFSVGLKAISEALKTLWYTLICVTFTTRARNALRTGEGFLLQYSA
jgi:hypothetical protein